MLKKARFALLVLLLAMLATTTVFAYENGDYDNGEAMEAAAPTFTIFHTNDVHGRFLPSGSAIGVDRIATIQAQTPNSILVDAGDTFHGLPFATINRGLDVVELMSAAGYNLFAPGNHDFNYGTDRLLELEAAASFDFISANVFVGDELLFNDIAIREVNGVTVGFFGLAHPYTYHLTNPNNVTGLTFACPVENAQIAVAALQELGVDVIVGLVHLGSGARSDYRIDGFAIEVANEVDGIDILIDGHSHNLHYPALIVNNTVIAQAGDHGRFLGRVDVVVEDGDVVSVSVSHITQEYAVENFESDEDVLALIDDIMARQSDIMDIVVAYLPFELYNGNIRSEEMLLGNLIADAVRWVGGADIAFTNGGGIRDLLPAGNVTKGDIISVLPFGNYVVTFEVTPAILRDALENGVSALPGGGRFPQVSGFSFTFNPDAEEGSRIISINIDGQYLDLNDDSTTFILATNNFIAAGGDAFTMFVDLPLILELGNLDEILMAYINEADLENLAIEGRIVVTDQVLSAILTPPPNGYVAEDEVEAYNEYEEYVVEEDEYVPVEVEEEYVVADEEEEYVALVVVEEEYVPVVVTTTFIGTATVINCWFLNVRSSDGMGNNIIGTLRAGDVVTVLEVTRWGWYRIQTPYITGWVFGQRFLQMN